MYIYIYIYIYIYVYHAACLINTTCALRYALPYALQTLC